MKAIPLFTRMANAIAGNAVEGETVNTKRERRQVVRLKRLTEKAFLQQVRDYARLRGWKMYHTCDSRCSEPGFPDLLLIRRGVLIVAELKSPAGKTTPAQDAWLDDFRAAGTRLLWAVG